MQNFVLHLKIQFQYIIFCKMLRYSKISQNTTEILDRFVNNDGGDDADEDKLLKLYQWLTHFRENLLSFVLVSSLQTSDMPCAGTEPNHWNGCAKSTKWAQFVLAWNLSRQSLDLLFSVCQFHYESLLQKKQITEIKFR